VLRSDGRPSTCFLCAPLVVFVALLIAPGPAFAGGDEGKAPPSAGPPGPWDDPDEVGEGEDVPYRPTRSRSCRGGTARSAGPGSVIGLWVQYARCRAGRRVVRAYQRCLNGERGRERGCYRRVENRCVQPVFLGGCRAHRRFYRRNVKGYRCVERRFYEVRDLYEGRVTCRKGRRKRVNHRYTLFTGAPVPVGTEWELRAAWANPRTTAIDVTADIFLRACEVGDPMRESARPVTLDGHGHTLRQTCFEKRLLRQDGTGFVLLKNVTIERGGSDGPGAGVTTRGEIMVMDSTVRENHAEEPGGGIMSQRRATIIRSRITGNIAWDDGGGVYARRGGIQVYDSILNGNLVDGSGAALGSTGDILVVRSRVDGNKTDGDGGALYADEDGDITVIDSTVSGNTADGPGGAAFTLHGDITVVGSSIDGNRADSRGGGLHSEGHVNVINSTVARNAAVAHCCGGIWSRGDLYVANSTVSDNYAEGLGGGLFGAQTVTLVSSTITENQGSAAGNVAAGVRLDAFGSIIGPVAPTRIEDIGGHVQPSRDNCRVPDTRSYGYNFATDGTCGLNGPGDGVGSDPMLEPPRQNGGVGVTWMPEPGSPAVDRIPIPFCNTGPLGEVMEGEQHLEGLVPDRRTILAADQRGVVRPQRFGCDAGAVERER
jgi:hypothetical protein